MYYKLHEFEASTLDDSRGLRYAMAIDLLVVTKIDRFNTFEYQLNEAHLTLRKCNKCNVTKQ